MYEWGNMIVYASITFDTLIVRSQSLQTYVNSEMWSLSECIEYSLKGRKGINSEVCK